jgi:FtsP/CotA-like multicopper oxidase with cupredoxin domain
MTTGANPYVVPDVIDDNLLDPDIVETKITVDETDVDMGVGTTVHALTFNGAIPGPRFRLTVGDRVIVRLTNHLMHPTGIHWHGVELENYSDGTPFTQNQSDPEHTFLYKFKVPRPGLYWYHPHHHSSTNQVFKGLHGMIIVTDPNEATLIAGGVLPGAADTLTVVLSDTTVCKAVGSNDAQTYNAALPWVGGGPLPTQPGPTPLTLCETTPLDEDGNPRPAFAAGDIPNIQQKSAGRTNEGQTVLTNGMNVGARAGSPTAPGILAAGAFARPVLSGQGLRLQMLNAATIRYFRLILTTNTGVSVPLVRVGGEGGLLDNAVVEGGVIGGFDTQFTSGEIVLPPGSRADVVAAIPVGASGTLTLWTQDYNRTGGGFANTPSVPIMHFTVTGAAGTPFAIAAGTALRAATGNLVEQLGAATGSLLNPATIGKVGSSSPKITIQSGPAQIDGVVGTHDAPYPTAPHLGSSRYTKLGDILELSAENTTPAHHPFHLHGFSMQPLSLTKSGSPTFTWPFHEFRDNIDLPPGYKLTFRIRIEDRPLADGITLGGALGRWMFHCHIFFHGTHGMLGEVVTTAPDGSEKPNVNVAGSWAYTPSGMTAERHGTFSHPDGDPVTLTTSLGTVTDNGDGTWSWSYTSTGTDDGVQYVYVTATDAGGRKDQAVFRLQIGGVDQGSDNGDPHITTVDGKNYDFQAVGEFILLRDGEGLEVQARQAPVPTATPVTDAYTGLTACVSINTAVAARVGGHRIAIQPSRSGNRELQFYFDGHLTKLPERGIDLGSDRVTAFPIEGGMAIRIDYASGAVVTITPHFWNSYNVWYLNVSVAHTIADEGIMGPITGNNWLPALPNGATLGPMPATLNERYVTLYKRFADAWRVTDENSLFIYAPGTSTATFTDRDWPAEKPPCKLKRQFKLPGAKPPLVNIPLATAKRICRPVTDAGLNRQCVFDVATTGDKTLVKGYIVAQGLKRGATCVQLVADQRDTRRGESVRFTVTVAGINRRKPTPTGTVTFLIDGVQAGDPVSLEDYGRAHFQLKNDGKLPAGVHMIRAVYKPYGKKYRGSSSPNLMHTMRNREYPERRPTGHHPPHPMHGS